MNLKIVNTRRGGLALIGIACALCISLGFGILLYAQDKTEPAEVIGTKPKIGPAKAKKTEPMTDPVKAEQKASEPADEKEATEKQGAEKAAKEKAAAEKSAAARQEQLRARVNRLRGRQGRSEVDFGENAAFYEVIVDNNLFRPLGWTPPKDEPAYSLIGTAIGAEGDLSQATLLESRSNRYHFVTIGTQVGDMTVKEISAKQVTLDKDGDPVTLRASGLQFLSTGSGRSGGGSRQSGGEQSGGSESQKSGNSGETKANSDTAKKVETRSFSGGPNAEFIEKMKNASPEERREMMREFRRNRGGDRGDRGGRGRRGRD